ncbi:helix-turn-helix domain-containing protein [Lacrimispora saccharolytica]|nr:helix-turn-helix domain-containing protein [Lacrimispora saccharolytica]
MNMKRGNFFVVQNQIFDFKLSPIAFYVYCYLCKCRNKKSGCYPSKQTIASACGIAVSSVSKAIKQLSKTYYCYKKLQRRKANQ